MTGQTVWAAAVSRCQVFVTWVLVAIKSLHLTGTLPFDARMPQSFYSAVMHGFHSPLEKNS